MLAVRASLLAVFALIGCALALDLARAQGPTTETETTLRPGVNLVGWTAEPTPVSQLFREIPQLESIWAWDAELRDWIVAAPDAPEWLGGLGRVSAGMGLRMQIGGDQPVDWRRSTEPTRGLVKLHTGWNLVAWSGADQTSINDAVKGIGWSLRTVRRWNPATQQWTTWTSPERTAQLIAAANTDQGADDNSEMPGIRRGEALWIEVARAVNWLQPTGVLPRLVFPGGASTALQARVREAIESIIAFYRDQYGIQADPDFTIYIAKDADALIQAQKAGGRDVDEASVRAMWGSGMAWAGVDIVGSQSSWADSSDADYSGALSVIAHEYFHMLQFGLSGAGWGSAQTPRWLIEGAAEWAAHEYALSAAIRYELGGALTGSLPIDASASLGDRVEVELSNDAYQLGWTAHERLTTLSGTGSYVEFWRRLGQAYDTTDPSPRWRDVFADVFGSSVNDFYVDLATWLPRITGSISRANGQPFADMLV